MASNHTSEYADIEKAGDVVVTCDQNDGDHQRDDSAIVHWRTGLKARFPYIGAAAAVLMLLCIAGAGAVMASSDGKFRGEWPAREHWKWVAAHDKWNFSTQIEPHVVLAILNTVSNVLLAVAIGQGVAIAWWRRAMKGSTIKDLHCSWGFATSVVELFTAGKRFNMIALAALMAKIALVDNVLLQRAVTTEPGLLFQNQTEIHLPIVSELPEDYAGFPLGAATAGSMTYAFGQDIQTYLTHDDFIDPTLVYARHGPSADAGNYSYNTHCIGSCKGLFEGFGFRFTCTDVDSSQKFDVTPENAARDVVQSNVSSPLQQNPLLFVQPQFIAKGQTPQDAFNGTDLPASIANQTLSTGSIGVWMKWSDLTASKDPSICSAATSERFCTLTPATVQYPVLIRSFTRSNSHDSITQQSNGISLVPNFADNSSDQAQLDWKSGKAATGQFDGMTITNDAYAPYDSKYDPNMQVIAEFLSADAASNAILEYFQLTNNTGVYAPNFNAANKGDSLFARRELFFDPGPNCATTVSDPLYDLAYDLNRLMLIASMHASTSYQLQQDGSVREAAVQAWQGEMGILDDVFSTNWAFGAAVMALNLLCLLCVLPSYWGFWELGRRVTLGPIEIAGAFQAPILDHPAVVGQGEVETYVKEVGERQVRYGEVNGKHRLGVARPADVRLPGTTNV